MAAVYISGSVTVNQGCEIPAGYSIEIPLGEYNARDFKDKKGAKPDNVRVIEKTLDFKCTNISDGVKIALRIEGTPSPNNSDTIDLGNPDIAAVVTTEMDKILRPNSTDNTEMTVQPLYNETQRNASVKIKAYPISTTGKMPTSGKFEGVATLNVEVE
ncbi:hypothetical protein AwEntero_08390 [Enterobacterales bacterium]|nr:hypothetical protein AwEntero_08390 [Enterobacterales bacterium]